ncbi:MAG TPA: VOC family protein [Catenuloplanes sp.]|jgi:hypothetical protein
MATSIFVNLPVNDLDTSVGFFDKLGFATNPQFTNDQAACIVISDTIHVMLLVKPMFQTFTRKNIVDAGQGTEVILALSADSREKVDELADTALAAGGSAANDPQDHGFMYSRSFQDPDGHLWEVLYMDPGYVQPQA